jgi:hypothetical protein
VLAFEIPTDDPPCGLHEHRQAKRLQHAEVVALARPPVRHLRDLRVGHHVLEDDLVHAQGRGEHPRAHIGHVGQLEQALNGAVLAKGPMKRGEDDVGAEQACGGLDRHALAIRGPAPIRGR